MSAMPSDPNSIAPFEISNIFAERIDHSGHLMPRRAWIFDPGKQSILRHRIAMTNSAGLNFYPNLSAQRLNQLLVHKPESSTSLINANSLHDLSPPFDHYSASRAESSQMCFCVILSAAKISTGVHTAGASNAPIYISKVLSRIEPSAATTEPA
jgi:hypothetical protein